MSNSWVLPSLTAREDLGESHLHSAKLGNFSQEKISAGTCRRSGVEMVFGAPADRLNYGSISKTKNTLRGQCHPPTCNCYSLSCYQKRRKNYHLLSHFCYHLTKEEHSNPPTPLRHSNPPAPLRKDIIFKDSDPHGLKLALKIIINSLISISTDS